MAAVIAQVRVPRRVKCIGIKERLHRINYLSDAHNTWEVVYSGWQLE